MAQVHMKDRHLERSRAGSRGLWLLMLLLKVALLALAVWLVFRPLTPPAAWLTERVSQWCGSAVSGADGTARLALKLLFGVLSFAAKYSVQGALAIAACVLHAIGRRSKETGDILSAGISGERNALNLMRGLPDDYHVFANCAIRYNGGRSETDLIVVGPGGVSVVEVKNVKGHITGGCQDHQLDVVKTDQYGIDHEKQLYNPIKQVGTHVYRLAGLLRENRCRAWVRGYVLFSHPETSVDLSGECDIPVFSWNERAQLLHSIQNDSRSGVLPQHVIKGVVKILNAR